MNKEVLDNVGAAIRAAKNIHVVGDDGLTLGLDSNLQMSEIEEIEEKPKVIGKFKTKIQFIDFIGAISNINVLSKTAELDGKYISGMLEDLKFKITICDDNTINFEEINGLSSDEELKRYISLIEDNEISIFRQKPVLSNMKFITSHLIKEKEMKFESYLIVEFKKPIDKLIDFMNEDNEDDFSLDVPDEDEVIIKKDFVQLSEIKDTDVNAITIGELENLKTVKKQQFLDKISNIEKELKTTEHTYSISYNKVKELKDEIKLLHSRIDSLNTNEPFNNYYFHLTESLSEKCILPDDITKLISDKFKSINYSNSESFLKLFSNQLYNIRICSDIDNNLVELNDFKDIYLLFKNFDIDGKIYISEDKIFYEGQLEWADINNKLVRLGFKTNPIFDKMCEPIKEENEVKN